MKAVRYVGKTTSPPSEYENRIADSDCAIVNTLPIGGNVTLRLTIDGKKLQVNHDQLSRDFLDLATLVYIVDEINPRPKSMDYWTRHFDILFPVNDPEAWAKNQARLQNLLKTLAGDEYQFTWCKRPNIGGYGAHRLRLPRGYDGVCLFSGGIDSFLGAHRLLSQGKKLLLCGHQADGTAASAQKELAQTLRKQFPGQFKLIQCRVARSLAQKHRFSLPTKCEETHRPRSFLFLALAISLANAAKIKTVYIPENGLIALNAPLGKSRIGSLSTRTAHPKYLLELAEFLSKTGVYNGEIKNPFMFDSKTDMMAGLDPKLNSSMIRSVSCARPSRYKNLGVRHCGYCVPCIYRRVAMSEAKLDVASEYGFDLFNDLTSVTKSKQMDFRSLVSFANRVVKSTSVGREVLVLSHGAFPTSAGEIFGDKKVGSYSIWAEMLHRWSIDFLNKLTLMSSTPTKRTLGIR